MGAPAGMSGIPAPVPMPGSMGPGIPRPADVPAPVGAPPMGQPGRAMRPPSDPFAPPAPAPMGGPGMGKVPGTLPPGTLPPGSARPMPAPMSAPPQTMPMQLDPFAAAPATAATGPREVRLVIDDKAVSDAEVGRQGGSKFAIAAAVVGLVGVAIGWFVGSTARERQLYDRVLQDAKEIYESTSKATPTVEKAQKLIDQAAKAAAGKDSAVDFKAIEELRALAKPFPADVFSRKLYGAFQAETVDALFTYYNQTNQLWAKLSAIAAKSLSPAAREALTKAAAAAGQQASSDYGCVPFKDGDKFACGLVTVTREEPKDGKESKMVKVAVRGQSADKNLFSGQDLGAKTSDYVIMVDKGRSGDILGGATNQFQVYARDLMEAKTLADQTIELQGRLVQQLGEIAKLESL
jgi:hypothetical protein